MAAQPAESSHVWTLWGPSSLGKTWLLAADPGDTRPSEPKSEELLATGGTP